MKNLHPKKMALMVYKKILFERPLHDFLINKLSRSRVKALGVYAFKLGANPYFMNSKPMRPQRSSVAKCPLGPEYNRITCLLSAPQSRSGESYADG